MRPLPRPAVTALLVALCACSPGGSGSPSTSSSAVLADPGSTTSAPATDPADRFTDLSRRAAHTATTLGDGRVVVAGGCVVDGCGEASAELFVISPDASTVVVGPSMTDRRDAHTATAVPDGRVVLVGGYTGEGRPPLDTIEIFDPAAGTVLGAGRLAQARGGHAATALKDGRVLVIGGWVARRTFTATTEIVDPVTRNVSQAAALPVALGSLDAVTLHDGRVLVTGGQTGPEDGTRAAALYDPARDTWTATGQMATARFKHISVVLDDGRVLVIGGTSDDRVLLASTEIFDPETGEFTPGPELAEPRYKMTGGAVVMSDNRVAIAGGGRTVEVLDLDRGTSTAIHEFSSRGSFATVNLLGSGDIIVVGGYDDTIDIRAEYAIIDPAAT